jgi:phage baseplate assembly protein W
MVDDETDIAILKFKIQEAIEKYEKRVEVNNIEIIRDESIAGEGTWIVEIDFKVIKYLKNDIVRFKLN